MTTETILMAEQKDEFVTDIIEYGTDFVAPLYATVDAIEQAVLQSEQVQAWKRDAERYRWLRDMIENQDLVIAKVGSWSLESWSGDDPDHYIDAAMETQS